MIRKVATAAFAAVCLGATAAAAEITATRAWEMKESRADVEGALKSPAPGTFSGDTAAVVEPVVTPTPTEEIVAEEVVVEESVANTPCGMNVVATSAGAVGDPCATTADVMTALNLTPSQVAWVNDHSSIGSMAH